MANAKALPPVEELRDRFNYDPETGLITFRNCYRKSWVGRPAGNIVQTGNRAELRLRWNGGRIRASRVAFKLMTGRDPDGHIDHINGNALDNRWANLREATASENAKNRRGDYGVNWHNKNQKWFARISDQGAEIWLGMFDSLLDAWSARKSAENRLGYL